MNYSSSSSSSLTLRLFKVSNKPKVAQNGTAKPSKNNNIQNAIPPIKRNATTPNDAIIIIFCLLKNGANISKILCCDLL